MDGSNTSKLIELINCEIEQSENPDAELTVKKILISAKPLFLEWARERLVLLTQARIKVVRRQNAGPHPYQMFLEGFRGLSVSLSLKSGGRVPLAKATITTLRKELKSQKPVFGAKAQRLMDLIDEMKPYADVQRGLTVQRYCELRAAGVTPKEFAQDAKPKSRSRRRRHQED
jgi:hypothetical protein